MPQYVFVGGPMNGRARHVDADLNMVQVSYLKDPPPLVRDLDPTFIPPDTVEIVVCNYQRQRISGSRQVIDHPSGRRVSEEYVIAEFFSPIEWDDERSVQELVKGYVR